MKIISSESVNCGHPDKTCDIIADSFLDEAIRQDKNSQMAVECAIKDNLLMIYGEATTKAKIDYEKIAREILKDIGYKEEFKIITTISQQSPQINKAVNQTEYMANDQGIMYGYATNETKEYMPVSAIMANRLMQVYEGYRRKNSSKYFSDAKSQVSIEYDHNKPIAIHTILMSVSHDEDVEWSMINADIKENVIDKVVKEFEWLANDKTICIVNPSGKFSIWGSFSDSGCVGRKIVIDTYGGVGRVGGGCFSSKNATKVDRSGAYYARYVAKNVVAHKLADICEIGISYAIGLPKPLSINIETFGTNKVPKAKIEEFINNNFDFSVSNIIKELDLLKPIYKKTACYGHFGRDEFSWEKIKKVKV